MPGSANTQNASFLENTELLKKDPTHLLEESFEYSRHRRHHELNEKKSESTIHAASSTSRSGLIGSLAGYFDLEIIKVSLCTLGIFSFFIASGFMHEKLFSVTNSQGKKFDYSIFMVFVFSLTSLLLSVTYIVISNGPRNTRVIIESVSDTFVFQQLGIASTTYITSLICSNYALTHVNYPTQVLLKSAKTVPIVIGGFLLHRKTYPWYDYFAVTCVTSGLVVFNLEKFFLSGGGQSKAVHTNFLGIIFCIISLACDGITGPQQDKLWKKRPQISGVTVMAIMNGFCAFFAFLLSFWFEGSRPIEYCRENPDILFYLSGFAFASTLGQFCIFFALKLLGSLHLAMITTVRKFSSVVFSVIFYKHHISYLQWVCVTAVFGSLALQSFENHKNKKRSILHEKKE